MDRPSTSAHTSTSFFNRREENMASTSTSNVSSTSTSVTPTVTRVPHTRVRLARSRNVIYSTYQHIIELYGPQMPVLVAESLHYIPCARVTASVNLNTDSAWAWYVCGRKLLVWHIPSYKDSELTVIAKEMLLPPSDLNHHAHHVYVFTEPKQVAPSCIAVSPEGVIRYWEVIGHHSSWIDVNANLGGEEVCGVHYIPPIGCLAVTTSGTMILITPTVVRGTATVTTRHVSQMPGWFDSIGRRVSSLIFGGASAPPGLETKIVKVLTSTRVQGYWHVFMLAGFSLNSWSIQFEGPNCNHLYEYDLEPIIRKAFPDEIAADPSCELLILDIRPSEGGCVTALVVSSSPRCYIIVEINGDDVDLPDTATRLCILCEEDLAVLEEEGRIANLKFLLLPATALVFNKFVIFAVPLAGGEVSTGEPLDLPGGVVLGGLMHQSTPIFFSATYGFVSITAVNTASIDILNSSSVDSRVTPRLVAAREPVSSTTIDYVSNLKLAFIHYIRKNMVLCHQVIKKEFPITENEGVVDSIFATTLIKVSLDIINDLSPKDHRWGEVGEGSVLTGTMSLHVETQLAEKRQAHDIFLQFAKTISSTIDLGKVTKNGMSVRTIHVLYEHNEKIIACLLLKRLQKKYPKLIANCVRSAANEMNFEPTREITSADFFFRYVSIVDAGLKAIISKCVILSQLNLGTAKFSNLLLATNDVVRIIFNAILRLRSKKGYFIDPTYVPWLSAPQPTGIYDHLSKLSHVSHEALTRYDKQSHRYKMLMGQFFYISNILLYLQMPHLERSNFNTLSASVIKFFMESDMNYKGLQLAYKYKNFEYLIRISYLMGQEGQIKEYIKVFGDEGFCFDLFKFLYTEGKIAELLNIELPEQYIGHLELFLQEHTILHWIYKLKNEHYQDANEILINLSTEEQTNLRDQQIIFSMAKLTALTGASPDLHNINRNIEIIKFQKNVPLNVFVRKGYDLTSLKLLPPSELIELYTGEENFEADEIDFKNALDILQFVNDTAEHENLRKTIWRRVIERDDWEKSDFTPEVVENLLLFKVIKLVKSSAGNLLSLIPSADDFVEDPDLPLFTKSSMSTYLLEYGYEQVMGEVHAHYHEDFLQSL